MALPAAPSADTPRARSPIPRRCTRWRPCWPVAAAAGPLHRPQHRNVPVPARVVRPTSHRCRWRSSRRGWSWRGHTAPSRTMTRLCRPAAAASQHAVSPPGLQRATVGCIKLTAAMICCWVLAGAAGRARIPAAQRGTPCALSQDTAVGGIQGAAVIMIGPAHPSPRPHRAARLPKALRHCPFSLPLAAAHRPPPSNGSNCRKHAPCRTLRLRRARPGSLGLPLAPRALP